MGCLNSKGQFDHYFGNIHLSGPCNRSCYFCIGQHMMALDSYNMLDEWPLPGLDKFVEECKAKNINEVNITGSNTDPLLYKHLPKLRAYLDEHIPNLNFGLRTNGVAVLANPDNWMLFDKASISITSLNPQIYKKTMGQGVPPDITAIMKLKDIPLKVNVVLCPETVESKDVLFPDILSTIETLRRKGIRKINLREPYGQPHIGDPLKTLDFIQTGSVFGNPEYGFTNTKVVYWDVHYTEVESVNLYANGVVSTTYPVTEGHDPVDGKVEGQEHFQKSGRVREQWVSLTVNGK